MAKVLNFAQQRQQAAKEVTREDREPMPKDGLRAPKIVEGEVAPQHVSDVKLHTNDSYDQESISAQVNSKRFPGSGSTRQ